MDVPPPRPGPLLLRLAIYSGAQAGLLYLHLRLVTDGSAEAAKAYLAEGGWLELLQITVLVATLLLLLARRSRHRTVALLLACAVAAALAREMDVYFAEWLWRRGHRVIMGAMAALGVAIAIRRRAGLRDQLAAFLTRPGFGLMFLGIALAALYGTVLGQNTMWLERSAAGFDRINKRFVEEGLEAAGYLWIFFGVLEEVVFTRPPRQS